MSTSNFILIYFRLLIKKYLRTDYSSSNILVKTISNTFLLTVYLVTFLLGFYVREIILSFDSKYFLNDNFIVTGNIFFTVFLITLFFKSLSINSTYFSKTFMQFPLTKKKYVKFLFIINAINIIDLYTLSFMFLLWIKIILPFNETSTSFLILLNIITINAIVNYSIHLIKAIKINVIHNFLIFVSNIFVLIIVISPSTILSNSIAGILIFRYPLMFLIFNLALLTSVLIWARKIFLRGFYRIVDSCEPKSKIGIITEFVDFKKYFKSIIFFVDFKRQVRLYDQKKYIITSLVSLVIGIILIGYLTVKDKIDNETEIFLILISFSICSSVLLTNYVYNIMNKDRPYLELYLAKYYNFLEIIKSKYIIAISLSIITFTISLFLIFNKICLLAILSFTIYNISIYIPASIFTAAYCYTKRIISNNDILDKEPKLNIHKVINITMLFLPLLFIFSYSLKYDNQRFFIFLDTNKTREAFFIVILFSLLNLILIKKWLMLISRYCNTIKYKIVEGIRRND